MESVLVGDGSPKSKRAVGDSERDAANTLGDLRSNVLSATPSSKESLDTYQTYDENAPLLKLFNNDVVSFPPNLSPTAEGSS